MSPRLKIILGALVAVAGFMLVRVGLLFHSDINVANTQANIANTINQTPEDNPLLKDNDQDGLPDRDEIVYGTDPFSPDTDGDGYKDGEETASGTDPLDSSDNTTHKTGSLSLLSPTANMTDRLLNLGIAGLVDNDGNLNPDQMTNSKFASIMSTINTTAQLVLSAPALTDRDIDLIEDNSPAAIQKYLRSASSIVEEGLFSVGVNSLSGGGDYLPDISKDKSYYFNKYYSLKAMAVPSSWKELHKEALADFYSLGSATQILDDQTIENDPVKASFALNQLQESYLALGDLLIKAAKLASTQKINTQDSILDTLHLSSQ